MSQKFKRGDKVHIAASLGSSMAHFQADKDAIIIGSYRDEYGGGPEKEKQYTVLMCDNGGRCSWYYDEQLTFVEHVGEAGIQEIDERRKAKDAMESDLTWIVAHWKEIQGSPSGATCEALMRLIGITEPWGSHGEGFVWQSNALNTVSALNDALMSGNIDIVKARADEVRKILVSEAK